MPPLFPFAKRVFRRLLMEGRLIKILVTAKTNLCKSAHPRKKKHFTHV